jgi:hypothetical protein
MTNEFELFGFWVRFRALPEEKLRCLITEKEEKAMERGDKQHIRAMLETLPDEALAASVHLNAETLPDILTQRRRGAETQRFRTV